MKIVINKLVGDLGEQWAIEVPVGNELLKSPDPVNAIKAHLAAVVRVVDDRLLELNMRLIEHNRVAQSLPPEGLLAVRQCVEVMYGTRRIPADGPEGKGVQGLEAKDVKQPEAEPVGLAKAGDALAKALEAVDSGK